MDTLRRLILFALGVFMLIYALTVHPVQIALVAAAFLLMGVVTWDQLTSPLRRYDNREKQESTDER